MFVGHPIRSFACIGLFLAMAPFGTGCASNPPCDGGMKKIVRMAHMMHRDITVVGRGEVKAKPTLVRTNLGIEASAPTVKDAFSQANAQMTKIIDALKKAGIADKDIRTSNFNVSFERPFQPPPMPVEAAPPPRGGAPKLPPPPPESPRGEYRVNNTVEVTVRDVSKAGEIIDTAVNAGANNVWGVYFGFDEDKLKGLEAEAREKAIADAKTRAEALAKLSGVELGPVVSVSEVVGTGGPPGPMPMAEMAFKGGGAPIEAGESTFGTQIQVVYSIKPPPGHGPHGGMKGQGGGLHGPHGGPPPAEAD